MSAQWYMLCHAGLRPRITAQTAALMSASIGMEFDSSSDEEEEDPTPINRHKGVFHLRVSAPVLTATALSHKAVDVRPSPEGSRIQLYPGHILTHCACSFLKQSCASTAVTSTEIASFRCSYMTCST